MRQVRSKPKQHNVSEYDCLSPHDSQCCGGDIGQCNPVNRSVCETENGQRGTTLLEIHWFGLTPPATPDSNPLYEYAVEIWDADWDLYFDQIFQSEDRPHTLMSL